MANGMYREGGPVGQYSLLCSRPVDWELKVGRIPIQTAIVCVNVYAKCEGELSQAILKKSYFGR